MLIPDWYVSKKLILFFDILFSLISLIMAYLIRFDFIDFYELFWINEYQSIIWGIPILLTVRTISFIIGKTHRGIIRHISSEDIKRIFTTVTLGSCVIGIISMIRYFFLDNVALLPKSILIIEYLGTLFLMLSSRFTVKIYYLSNLKKSGEKNNVLIYGSGKMGLITKSNLERDENSSYKIVGFIDDEVKKEGLLIERKPIIHPSNLIKKINDEDINTVIIAIKNPLIENKRNLIDICLENNIKIKSVPSVDQWLNGNFSNNQISDIKIDDLLGRKIIKIKNKEIENEFSNQVILISGAAGSIGSEIVRQVIKYSPNKVILLDQAESELYNLNQELISNHKIINWEIVVGDITREERMKKLFEHFKPKIIFHAAAYKHVPLMESNPSEAIKTNVQGTKILADLSVKNSVKKFILISTDKAVNPTNIMGASKRIAEMYCQSLKEESNTKFITTRFGNVLGSNGSVIPLFKKQLENGGPITVTDPNVTRYFMTIPEACQLVIEASTIGRGGEIYVFDMGKSIKIIDLAKKMIQLSGLVIEKDISIKITGLRPGEKMYEELLSNQENTIPTHHPKILIGKVKLIEHDQINKSLEKLISYIQEQKNETIVKQMKLIVPEFISNNSEFTKFDL